MKHPNFFLLTSSLFLAASAAAAVPHRWTVETTRISPEQIEAYRGETLALEATLNAYGKPLETALESPVYLYWQTNGMGAVYWVTNATVAASNVLAASFLPSFAPAASAVQGFIGSPSSSYRASFAIRFRNAPGETPNVLPLPAQSIDFDTITVYNPPYYTKYEVDEKVANATPSDYAAVSNAAMTALQPAATNGLVTASVTNGLASLASLAQEAKDRAAAIKAEREARESAGYLTAESDPVFAAWTNGASIVAGEGATAIFGGIVIGDGAKGGGVVIGENADSGPDHNVAIGKNTASGYFDTVVIGSIGYYFDGTPRTEAQGNGTFNISTADPAHFWFGAANIDSAGNSITPRTLQSYLDERATTNDLAATDANVAANADAISAVSDELGQKAKRYALVASASASISAADGNLYALVADTNGVAVTLPAATSYVQDFVIRLEPADTNGTCIADIAANPADATAWQYDYPLGTNDVRGVVTEATYFTFTQVTTSRWSIGCYPATKKED